MVEAKSLWGRWALIGFVVGAAVLAFLSKRTPEKPWGVALGQDLRGGTTLRFALDIGQAQREGRVDPAASHESIVEQTIGVIDARINRFGLSEVSIVPIRGEDKFEISLPAEIDPESIKRVVSALGQLQFRIEVLPSYPEFTAKHAGTTRTRNQVWVGAKGTDAEGAAVEYPATPQGFDDYKAREVELWKQAHAAAKAYEPQDPRWRVVPHESRDKDGVRVEYTPTKPSDFAVLEEPADKNHRFGGEILSSVGKTSDESGNPAVSFKVALDYQKGFGDWTGENVGLPMAIVLNEEVHTAPTIQQELTTDVQVTLGGGGGLEARRNLEKEQAALIAILQSGSLRVKPAIEATSFVGATLAGEAQSRGVWSTGFAFLVVLLYMVLYYFRSGLIADVALLLNLVLLVGAMAFLDAVLTLPGIAGVVLTLGMAVDANILVYERIREEQQRGRSIQKAVSEGFDRAFTTIVDSHVTTFLTAIFLYIFGAGSIKGFAVTLGIGLIASMFTSVYVTRTIFEAWIRRGKVKHIAMLGTGKAPSIHWMRMRRYFIPASIVLTVAALLVFTLLPRSTIYDIDFTGGMKLQVRLSRPTTVEEVKRALDSGPRKVRVPKDPSRGETGLLEATTGPYPAAEVVQVGGEGTAVEVRNALRPAGEDPAALREREQVDALKAYAEQALQGRLVPTWVREAPAVYAKKGDADPHAKYDGRLHTKIALYDPRGALTAERLRDALVQRLPYAYYGAEGRTRELRDADTISRDIEVVEVPDAADAAGGTGKTHVKTFEIWWKADEKGANPVPVETEPARLESDLREFLSSAKFKDFLSRSGAVLGSAEAVGLADPFPGTDLIGEGAAKKLRNDALLALLASLGAIVIYVAFRFRSYAMGFSAVIILLHDVFVALLAVCIVDWMGILDARINLGLVAAFLTIVGYSVNEVVVTFDRIRELRGSAPKITARMIEDGINQTFSRTMRTTMTVILTVIVLFVMNLNQRSMLEGLSFTLLVGITSGRYSAVGVAGPLLLFLPWFWAKARPYAPKTSVLTWPTRKNGMWILLALIAVGATLGFVAGHRAFLAVFYGLVVVPLAATLGLWLAWLVLFSVVCFVWSSVLLIPWSFHEDPEAAADAAHRELNLAQASAEPKGGALPAGERPAGSPAASRETPRSAETKKKGG